MKKSNRIKNTMILSATILFLANFVQLSAEEIVHIVKSGDTLWAISNKYLENPFLWKRLWEANTEIKNPDLIYPGNRVIIIKGDEKTSIVVERDGKRLELASTKGEAHPNATDGQEILKSDDAPKEQKMLSTSEANKYVEESVKKSKSAVVKENEKVEIKQKIKTPLFTLISEEEMKFMGIIVDSKDNKLLFSYDDIIYIKFTKKGNVAKGDLLTIVRDGGKIYDIVDKKKFLGNQMYKVAELLILGEINELYESRIIKSYEPARIGYKIITYYALEKEVSSNIPAKDIRGLIIGSEVEQNIFSNNDIVYINRGRSDGVIDGDTFVVPIDAPYSGSGFGNIPQLLVGRITVIETYQKMSICMVTESTSEIKIGYRFQKSIK